MLKTDVHLHISLNDVNHEGMVISSAEKMISHLKKHNISKGILMSFGEDSPLMSNSECQKISEMYPETYHWMCNLDYVNQDTVYNRLKSCKDLGAIGIGELMINKNLNDEFIQEIFKSAEQLQLPILFHMSPEEGFEYGIVDLPGLVYLEENLKRYPDLKFIGHSQVFWHEMTNNPGDNLEERNSWGEGLIEVGGRVPYLFNTYDNLYGDLSANSGGRAIMRDKEFGIKFLEDNQDRLMFGTDMVNTDMEFPLGSYLDELYENNLISKDVYSKICYKNANELFKIGGNNEN